MTPRASIVIVHHRGLDRLLRTLEPVVAQALAEKAEVVLVDNGSREGAGRALRSRFPSVIRVPLESNVGFAAGCRRGAEAGTARHLIFLNDDAVPEEGWLAAYLEAASWLAPDVTALAGRLTDAEGTRNDFSGGFLTFDGHAFAANSGQPLSSYEPGPAGAERLFACGGNMLVVREAFFETGGFDDDFFAYQEDVDFGWRQWILGGRILFEPRACARHEGGATGEALGVFRRGFLIERNAFATAYKNFEERYLRDLLPAILAAFCSRLSAMISLRNPGAELLRRDPYRDLDPTRRRRWSAALRRLLGFRELGEAAVLTDPLTIAQLRALLALFGHADDLERKRRWVQSRRKRSDREIFSKFPVAIVPTYPGDEIFESGFFRSLAPSELPLSPLRLSEIFAEKA